MSANLSPSSVGHTLSQQRARRYPSPFLDIAQFYQPRTVKSLFRWCRYYMHNNPVLSGVIRKKAQYPLTGLKYKHHDKAHRDRWRRFLEDRLKVKSHYFECSLDVQAYGNAFSSIYFPFFRVLVCRGCGRERPIEKAAYQWKNFNFVGKCKECGHEGRLGVRDIPYRYSDVNSPTKIRLVRWPVDNIEIDYTHISGRHRYSYAIPGELRKRIMIGHRETLASYPVEFFAAVKNNSQRVQILDSNIYHWKRPGISGEDMAWGEPAIISTLKHLYVMHLFIKAREQLAHQHVVPLWVLFPQPVGNTDPLRGLDLGDWRARVEVEIVKWLQNPNYIPVMPIPLGTQFIGGNASKLSVVEDIKAIEADVLVALMVPPEFAYSGSWSGSSIAIRLLENEFMHTQEDLCYFTNYFLIPALANHTRWMRIDVGFKDLRLQDDVQRKNFRLALADRGMMSRQGLLEETNEDYHDILEQIEQEKAWEAEMLKKTAKSQAVAQGEAELIAMKNQVRNQILGQVLMRQVAGELTEEGYDAMEIQGIVAQLQLAGQFNPAQSMGFLGGQQGAEAYSVGGGGGLAAGFPGAGGPPAGNGGGNGKPTPADQREQSPRFAGRDDQFEYYKLDMNQQLPNFAAQLLSVPESERSRFMEAARKQSPAVYQMLLQALRQGGQSQIDMRPMPEKLPPRRASLQ